MKNPVSTNVTNPPHYAGCGIECKDALKSLLEGSKMTAMQDYWRGCAFKYLWRADKKNGVEDLQKARQCIDYLIEDIEATQAPNGMLTELRKEQ